MIRNFCARRALIGGEWVEADNGATHGVINPATREMIGTVPVMGAAETRRAIAAAAAAQPAWAARTAKERAAILRRWYELMHGEPGRPGARS